VQGKATHKRPRRIVIAAAGVAVLAGAAVAVFNTGPWRAATAYAVTFPVRTWVSGVGDDANSCSRTFPCKTFAGAISKTEPGGVISVLDPGSFGAVTITHSIMIEARGELAGLLAFGFNGIVVNAGPNDVVTLRGLSIEGGQGATPANGIDFLSGGKLIIEDTSINGMLGNGIIFEPNTAAKLFVYDSYIHNNLGGSGIRLSPRPGGSVNASINGTRLADNSVGLLATLGAKATLSDSVADGNNIGVHVNAAGTNTRVAIHDSSLTGNNQAVLSTSAKSTAILDATSIANNAAGLVSQNTGKILSFHNNPISDSGAPTGTLSLK
jgi:Right handed beta helix region